MDGKKLFSKRDALLFLGILIFCALLFLLFSLAPQGTKAVVEQNGRIVAERELSRLEKPETIELEGADGLSLAVSFYPDGVAVTKAGCPDQVCVRTGKLRRAGESVLCLPAKISVRLEGASGVDATTF